MWCPNLLRSSTASFASQDLSRFFYYHKCILVLTLSICYICLILTKLNFGWQILVKTYNIKFHTILYRWELICFTQTDMNANTCICSSFAKITKTTYQFKGLDREILNPVQGFLGNQNFKMSHVIH